jgi:hypothetical protein
MSSSPSNPAAPDAHTIGKSGQDVTDPSAPQGDNSLVSSSIESVQSPLLKSSAEEPARRVHAKHPPGQLHQLQDQRLHELGQMMPLTERLHCLQTGQCMSSYNHAFKQYVAKSRRKSSAQREPAETVRPVSDSPDVAEHSAGASAAGTAQAADDVSPRVGENHRVFEAQKTGEWISLADDLSVDESELESYIAEAQIRFNLYVQENTTLIDLDNVELPPDAVLHICACLKPCALRSHNDEQYEGSCLWVCATGSCMTWQDAEV